MTNQRSMPPRSGLTLIELLTVMFILGILFSLGYFFYPSYSAKQKMTTATDRISGALLAARQRAKRDGVPTGIRFLNNEMIYIQTPDTPSIGRVVQLNGNIVLINKNLVPGGVEPLVVAGDYVEINGGGRLYQLVGNPGAPWNGAAAIFNGTHTLLNVDSSLPAENYDAYPQAPGSNYRIHARPRPLAGEEPIKLPNDVTVTVATGGTDVVFSPSGSVILQTNTQGHIFLEVRDTDPQNAGSPEFIVGIRLRTGLIGVYNRSSGADPYINARAGITSGL